MGHYDTGYDLDRKAIRERAVKDQAANNIDFIRKLRNAGELEKMSFLTDVMIHIDEWMALYELGKRLGRKG